MSLVTDPRGLTTPEVSLLLSNHLGVPIAAFDSLAHARLFLDSLGIKAPSIEGYLAPETYEFLPGTSPEVAFRTMARRTQRVMLRAARRSGLAAARTVVAPAADAGLDRRVRGAGRRERPRIARVYLNRLEKGMRLQADPTVNYAMGRGTALAGCCCASCT